MPDPAQSPLTSWQKAQHIGPSPGVIHYLPTPAEQADPIRKLIEASHMNDPMGLGQDAHGVAPAGIGGLPEGLNPMAIGEMLKREGIGLFDGAESSFSRALEGLHSAMGRGAAAAPGAEEDLTGAVNALSGNEKRLGIPARARSFLTNTPQGQ